MIFSPGDWVVHPSLGVGQVIAIEDKSIGDKETTYYRIDTGDSTLWVPLGEESLLRQVAPPEEFAKAKKVFQRPSRRMSSVFQSRLARIRRAKAKGTPQALARIVRDLWARKKRRGQLSSTEHQILRDMMDRLLAEWSVSLDMDENQMKEKLFSLLKQNPLPTARS